MASGIAALPTPTCSVFVQFYVRIVECSKSRGGKSQRLSIIFISLPSFLPLSTIPSNRIRCSDVLSPVSSPLVHNSPSAFSSPFSASATPMALWLPYLRQDKQSVLCLFNISPLVGGCFIYRGPDTCGDSLTERHYAVQ